MNFFLKQTANYIYNEYKGKFHQILIVLPGRRSALYLKNYLKECSIDPIISPRMLTIEEFIEEVSGLSCPDNLTLNLELFSCWKTMPPSTQFNPASETLADFLKWSSTLLHDFNEIDRGLANAEAFFSNLKDIKFMEQWSLNESNLTEFQLRYLNFMEQLGKLYASYKSVLLSKQMAWPGLAGRIATEKIETSVICDKFHKILFIGFNALNKCEKKIFNYLSNISKADFIWDIDNYYFTDPNQEAGLFLRQYFNETHTKPEHFVSNDLLNDEKKIEIIAAAGHIGQAATGVSILEEWEKEEGQLEHTAIVLADESLLFPVLNTLPENLHPINVTLEYPLKLTAVFDFYELLIQWQVNSWKKNTTNISIYYKEFFRLFYNKAFRLLFSKKEEKGLQRICDDIISYNISFISPAWLLKHSQELFKPVEFLFEKCLSAKDVIIKLEKINQLLRDRLTENNSTRNFHELELTYLDTIEKGIIKMSELLKNRADIADIPSVFQLLKEIISGETVSFSGQPVKGLQLMGVLETRTLDFEKVVILGLNEGILPAGKSNSSFIPFDLKKFFGLPVHYEKDAVYAYHFYRLIQRAKKICLVYNTETDTFGSGEKSRFITQLQFELTSKNKKVFVRNRIASGTLKTKMEEPVRVSKNQESVDAIIKKLSGKTGLSASAINLYKECNLKFWFKYVVNLAEQQELDEEMQAGTFGNILIIASTDS